jgi:sugar (pentulose or hexulose) kinase
MNEAAHVLAIDGGGSSVKASLVRLADGRVAAVAREEYRVLHPLPERAEFDAGDWWRHVVAAAAGAARAAPDAARAVEAIVCTGMRIPFVLVDEDGHEVGPGILNHDRRGGEVLDRVRAAAGPGLYARTGHWPAPEFGLGKLAWLALHEPARVARARHVLQFHDWLVFRLCGAVASEPSSAAMSGALDLARGGWAEDLLADLGLPPALFPPLVPAGTPLGAVHAAVADAIGVPADAQVLAGAGDTHMSCLGVGNAAPGDVTVVAGSTTPVMLAAATPLLDPAEQPVVSPHVFAGVFAIEVNAGATGIRFTWLQRLASELAGRPVSYDDLSALAAASPTGARGLFVVAGNPEWGEAAWAATPPGAVVGLTPSHTAGDLARATLEGSAIATAAQVDRLERVLGERVARVCASGGATRSATFGQLLADVSGRRIEVPAVDEPSAHAAALVALGDADALPPPPATTFEPDAGATARYAPVRERYASTFAALREATR